MLYTFVLGTPVYAEDRHLGKLERIIVDNGIANQITVAPGLLGIERVVPINDIVETSTDSVQLRITDEDWRAYSAFQIQQAFGGSQEVVPGPGFSARTSSHNSECNKYESNNSTWHDLYRAYRFTNVGCAVIQDKGS
jgi:hypothetical protein